MFRPARDRSLTTNAVGKVTTFDARGTFAASIKDPDTNADVVDQFLPYAWPLIDRPAYGTGGHLRSCQLLGVALGSLPYDHSGNPIDESCSAMGGPIPPSPFTAAQLRSWQQDWPLLRWRWRVQRDLRLADSA